MKKSLTRYFKNSNDGFDEFLAGQSLDSSSGVLVFCAEKSSDQVIKIQKTANTLGIALAGAIFPGVIANGKVESQGFIAFVYKEFPRATFVDKLDENYPATVSMLADKNRENETLFMLLDGGLHHVVRFLDAMFYEIADEVEYFGSCCGSETNAAIPCIFNNHKFEKEAALFLFLPYESSPVLEHDYKSTGDILNIGRIHENMIMDINWKPASDSYQKIIQEVYHSDEKIEKDRLFQTAVHYPFGINRMDGENIVRIPVQTGAEGEIYCAGEIPENSVITMMLPPKKGNENTVNKLLQRLQHDRGEVIVAFYCIGRRQHMGEFSDTEISLLSQKLENQIVMGALSTGEIGNSLKGGYPLLQNATILCGEI